jgi:hypothetical protein
MFDKEGFITAINNMKQRPRTEWLDFAKNMYQSKNQNFTQSEMQARQIMQNNPQLAQFTNMINSQFGIRF